MTFRDALMISLIWVFFTHYAYSNTIEITDMMGRRVEIPETIHKIYCSTPVSSTIIYTIDPELLVGLPFKPSNQSRDYFPENYLALPILGGWFGKGHTVNIEEIIRLKPDMILSTADSTSIDAANKRQAMLGIPVVLIKGNIHSYSETYHFLGNILKRKTRTDVLSEYSENTLKDIKQKSAQVNEKSMKTVYYSEGPKGLNSEPKGSRHAIIFDLIKAKNIAQLPIKGGYGRAVVSMEEVLKWQPDIIFCCPEHSANDNCDFILNDPVWKSVTSIRNGNFHRIPNLPFNWFDRPPSVNRLIGLKWVGHIIYPNIYPYHMREEVRYFYQLFYHYNLSDSQLNDLLSPNGVNK